MLPSFVQQSSCHHCLKEDKLGFDLRMAFQPIVDLSKREVYAYEALVRGPEGQSAAWVIDRINSDNRYYFDQACRVTAIKTASELGLKQILSINFMPNAIYNPENCIRATLAAADHYGFDIRRIMFEVIESEQITNQQKLKQIIDHYQARGFLTAVDDFGSGYTQNDWLLKLKPNLVKLDRSLISNIDQSADKQVKVTGILALAEGLGVKVLAEGVETLGELNYLSDQGITLFQGYLFARPELEALPCPSWPLTQPIQTQPIQTQPI